MLIAEALHDHGLAHPAVTIDRDRRHAGASRMIKERLEPIKGLLRAGVENPTAGPDGANASRLGFRQQGRRVGGQVRVIVRSWWLQVIRCPQQKAPVC